MPAKNKKKLFFKKSLSFYFFLSLLLLAVSAIGFLTKNQLLSKSSFKKEKSKVLKQTSKILGESASSAPKMFIWGSDSDYGGGVIALSESAEPQIEIETSKVSGKAEISLYKAGKQDLLDYLTHDSQGNQLKKTPDLDKLEYLTTISQEIKAGYNQNNYITLPIEKTGLWYLEITLDQIKQNAFVVRSSIAAILKEGDNQFIVWGQDLKSKRSLQNGLFTTFNLQDQTSPLAKNQLDNQGIAKIDFNSQADIGLLEKEEEVALIPINLQYLNRGASQYKAFREKERKAKFYLFTDRPVYKPGDKLYFKSIVRDDNDADYTIPTGNAEVKLYKDWDEKNTIFTQSYPISAQGTVDGEIQIPADVSTGDYNLQVDLGPGSENFYLKGYRYLQIEHFRKPEYTIDISVDKKEFIAGEKLSFKITGNYFSGQSLNNQEIKYKITASKFYEYDYSPNEESRLTDDYRYGYWNGKIIQENKATFNQQGEAEIQLKLSLPEENKYQTQVFSIEAEFDDGSGNPVFARKNILVYPGEFGIYKKEPLHNGRAGEETNLPLVLALRKETKIENIKLETKIKRATWVSYQEEGKKYRSYKKEEEELPAIQAKTDKNGQATLKFIPEKKGSYTFTVQAKDQKGNIIEKELHLWIVSPDQPLYRTGKESKLSIQPDKEKYQYTETAQLTITSEIADRDVFLSLDRARVHRFQIVKLQGKSQTVKVSLKESDIPNIFAKVASFSDSSLNSDTQEINLSTDAKKIVFTLETDKKTYGPGDTLTLNLQTTDINGKPLSTNTAVWAVDKAIFELAEQSSDVMQAFWHKRYEWISESHSLQGINVIPAAEGGGCFTGETPILLPNGKTKPIKDIKVGGRVATFKGENDFRLTKAQVKAVHSHQVAGLLIINQKLKTTPEHRLWVNGQWKEAGSIKVGDTLKDKNNKSVTVDSLEWQKAKSTVYNLIIEKEHTYFANGFWVHNDKGGGGGRSVFKDTAYWNPSVQTDQNGKAKLTFKLPDNLTTWVISSVGSTTDTKVGQKTQEIIVTKNVIVRPILPNIMRLQEQIVLSCLVQNFTDQDHQFNISLEFEAGEIQSEKQLQKQIKANGLAQVYWQVSPKEKREQGELIFSAQAKENQQLSDKIEQKIPIQAFGFWEKRGESGIGNKEFLLSLASDSDKEKSKATLFLAPSLLTSLPSAMRYLVNYPWGCVEQVTSRLAPALIAKANPDIFSQTVAEKNVDDIIRQSILKLSKAQKPDGGWTWWYCGQSNYFITAHVVEYLVEVRNLGIPVEEQILGKAGNFLKQESYHNRETGKTEPLTDEEKVARIYGLSFLQQNTRSTYFDNLTADIAALQVINNLKAGNSDPQANGLDYLLSLTKSQGDALFWEAGESEFFGSTDASTALAIRAMLAAGEDRETIGKAIRFLARNRQKEYWSNTFATAQVIRAIVDYSRQAEELVPNYNYTVKLNGQSIAQGLVTDYQKPIKEITIKGENISHNSQLTVEKSAGSGEIYSTLLIEEFHTNKNAQAVNHGLEIKREYSNEKGKDYPLAVGDTAEVKLTVSGLKTPENYAIIVDELPSGMIPINTALKNEQYEKSPSSYHHGVTDQEITKNGAILSLRKIDASPHTYSYKARVISEGKFSVPPATVSLMYAPEIYGHSQAQTIKIEKESKMPLVKTVEKKIKSLFEKEKILLVLVIIPISALGFLIFKATSRKKANSKL